MATAIASSLPVLLVVALLSSAYILPVLARVRRFSLVEYFSVVVMGAILCGAAYLAREVLINGTFHYIVGGWKAPWGIELAVNPLAALFLITIGSVALPILLYASVDLVQETGSRGRATWFLTLFLLLSAALCGLALASDLFNVYVFVEVATIASCALVAGRNDARSVEATFKYLMLATIGSGFILLGIGFTYILSGNLSMAFVHQELAGTWQYYPHALWLALCFFLVGFGVKSALFPLHVWLPDAHSTAISPASAMLSSLAVKGYIIALIKILFLAIGPEIIRVLSITSIMQGIGMLAIIAGAIFALAQDELKRRLAFSTVSQIGYIFLGIGLGTAQGLSGALLHITSHALTKSLLFLAAGNIIKRTGKHKISELAGVGRKMPITVGVFTVGTLSMVGIPLFSGFVSKWSLLLGSLEAGNALAVAVLVLGSLLAAAYLLPVVRTAFFEKEFAGTVGKGNKVQLIALATLACFIVLMGTIPGPIAELARLASRFLLGLEVV